MGSGGPVNVGVKPQNPVVNRSHPLAKGLAAALPMQDGGGGILRDVSGHGRDAALYLYGGVPVPQFKQTPYGGGIDPSAKAPGMDMYMFVGQLGRTVSVLFKADSLQANYSFGSYGPGWTNRWYMQLQSDGTIDTRIGSAGAVTSSIGYSVGEWIHYVVTYDGAYANAYINGVLGSSQANSTLVGDVAGRPTIGGFNEAGYVLDGVIADVRIWNRGLKASEVAALYQDPWDLYRPARPVRDMYRAKPGIAVKSKGNKLLQTSRNFSMWQTGFRRRR